MSRLPPISRGGIVRRPALAAAGIAVSGNASATGAPAAASASSAPRDLLHQLPRGRDANDTGERVARDGHARQLRRARLAAGDLPLDEVRVGEQIGEETEAGDDGGDAEVRRLVADELDVDRVPRRGAFDVDGTRERMAEAEVDRLGIVVGARAA